ncbi:MAG TPA: hypothetical protein VFG78_05240 [Gemmatimonadota bacterium]|nr:hypothetical protein [Gemmatimonadota bacterium]
MFRDGYGVPYVFGPTDESVVFGSPPTPTPHNAAQAGLRFAESIAFWPHVVEH